MAPEQRRGKNRFEVFMEGDDASCCGQDETRAYLYTVPLCYSHLGLVG